MKLLDKSTKITDPLSLTFNIKKSGWYLLIISARLKSKKQRGENETNDEDLTVGIDERVFPHPSSSGRLIDSPAAFSGGQLHNRLKTVYFITHLTFGDRTITLTPQYGAEVEEVSYEETEFEDSKINLSLEKQAEKANGRSWITFVLDDLNLKSITAKATVDWRFPDGDDVKLIVDGKIKKNSRSIRHKNWIWASNVLHKIFGGEAQEKTFREDLPQGLHYIEFHSDESPVLHYVIFDITELPLTRAKVVVGGANLRQEPSSVASGLLTFEEGDVVEVLQKSIEGEAPYQKDGDFTNIWHKVKFRGIEGYAFSKTVEIDGEDQSSVSKKIVQITKELGFDSLLALAIAKRESWFFPYAVSSWSARGLFQVTDDALGDIENQFKPDDIFDIRQNIEAGVRYLIKLRDHYFRSDPEQELKVIAAYNAGPTAIKASILLSEQTLSLETQKYIEDVLRFREEFKKREKWLPRSSLFFLLVVLLGLLVARYNFPTDPSRVLGDVIERSETDEFANTKKSLVVDLDGNRVAEEIVFVEAGPTPVLSWVSVYLRQDGELVFVDKVGGHFEKAQAVDLDEDGVKELLVEVVSGHLANSIVYRYRNETLEYVPEVGSKLHGLFSENSAVIADINYSESKELILYSFWPPDEECKSIAKIYLYRHGQLVKYLDAVAAEEFCRLKPTFWGI